MTTQELKQYIDKVLGNSIRCLLPSYWWKRLFNQVADRIDEVEQTTSQLIDSKVEEVKMPIVESVDELSKLDLPKGRVAAVEKTGEPVVVNLEDCFLPLDSSDWDKCTIVRGVEKKDNIGADADGALYFVALVDGGDEEHVLLDDTIVVGAEDGLALFGKITHGAIRWISLQEANEYLASGKYRYFYSFNRNSVLPCFTFYSAIPQTSLYIKGDSWERLAKEYVVSSEEELNTLSVGNGTIAKVARELKQINRANCHTVIKFSDIPANWDKFTHVDKVEHIGGDTACGINLAHYDGHNYVVLRINFAGSVTYVASVYVDSTLTNEVSITKTEVDVKLQEYDFRYIGPTLTSGEPYIDSTFILYEKDVSADAYIKGDSWEMLTKENVVNSEDELDGLDVPYGSIAKVNSKKYGKINPYNCYRITSMSSSDIVKINWYKLKRITQIDVINPDAEPSIMPTIYLHGYANLSRDLIQISYYDGYKVGTGNSSSTTLMSFDELNSLLKNSDYRLLWISDTAEHREFFDKYVSLYSPDLIAPNAYIKGDSWERLAKESDLVGIEGGSGDEIRELYVYKNESGSITELTDEQKAWNTETVELVEQGKAVAIVKVKSSVIVLDYIGDNNFLGDVHLGGWGIGLTAVTVKDGNATIEFTEIEADKELSSISQNPVKNWVITAALNNKVDKVEGKQLSTEDFTTALKTKLEGLNAFDPTEINNKVDGLQTQLDTLVSGDASTAIESFNEITAFLNGMEDSESLDSIIAAIEQQIAAKQDKLVSGTNIKTINGESILGGGDITISGGVSEDYVNTAIANAITTTLNTAV